MKVIILITSFFVCVIGISQNLMMNPSFEEYYECPTGASQIHYCKGAFNPTCGSGNTYPCSGATSDYFNACATLSSGVNVPYLKNSTNPEMFRNAKDGDAYIGIGMSLYYSGTGAFTSSWREYAQIKLMNPLEAGKKYDFSFYAGTIPHWSINIEINELGIHFVNDSIVYQTMKLWEFMDADWVSNEYIWDTLGWQKLSGSYIANGGEQWMIIGIFTTNDEFGYKQIKPGSNGLKTTGIYLDAFYMEEHQESLPSPTISTIPPTCTEASSATISNYDSSYTYTFSPSGPTVNNNGIISGMAVGTNYTVTAHDGSNDSEPSEAFSIEAQFITPDAPTVISPQTLCAPATVADLQPFSTSHAWYASAQSETPLQANETLSSGTYYVTESDNGCESEKASVEVVINPAPTVTISPNSVICKGDSLLLTASGADNYTWSPTNENGNQIIVHPTNTTSYTVTGTANGCSSTATTTVTVMNNPHASFIASPDSGYVPLSVVFTNTSSGATSYTWYIDSSLQATSTDFSATFEEEGAFLITLIADNGVCPPDTAYKTLITLLPAIIEIPNVFTPNNDAINDLWIVKGKVKNVVILNRWGNVVFQTSNNFTGWNGKDQHGKACTSGVYFYKIEDTNEEVHVGFLTLVR